MKVFGRKYKEKDINNFSRLVSGYQATGIIPALKKKECLLGSVKIKTTRKCNLNCVFCSRGLKDTENLKKSDPLTFSHLAGLFEDIALLGGKKIHLTGGEFFLRKDFLDILKEASSLGLKITITSNGTLITKELIEKIKSFNITAIQVSLDSFSEIEHDKIRGQKGAFQRSVNALIRIKEGLPGTKRNINVVVTKSLFRDPFKIISFVEVVKPDNLLFIPLKGDENSPGMYPSGINLNFFNRKIFPKLSGLVKTGFEIKNFSLNRLSREKDNFFYQNNHCFAPWTHSYIHDNGKVSLCCHRPDGFYAGNILKKRFKKIFLDEFYNEARNKVMEKEVKRCLDCEMFQKENIYIRNRSRQTEHRERVTR